MINSILYATGNPGKIHSLQTVLNPLGISVSSVDLEIVEIQANSAREVAEDKVQKAFAEVGKPVVVQDSAFIIPSLCNFPGPYTKYMLETVGLEGILRVVESYETPCSFSECLAYYDGSNMKVFETLIPGILTKKIAESAPKHATSPLWKAFIPLSQEKTLAEMSEEEMSAWRQSRETDHYGIQLAKWLETQNATA